MPFPAGGTADILPRVVAEKLRAQLESYLVHIGILQEKQTLSAQVDVTGERNELTDERAIEQGQ